MNTTISKKNLLILVFLGMVTLAIGFGLRALALTNTSTNDTDSPNVWHMIAYHKSNMGYSMDLGVYYDSWPAGGTIRIDKAPEGGMPPSGIPWEVGSCYDLGSRIMPVGANNFAEVRLKGVGTPSGTSERNYTISQSRFCDAPAHNQTAFFGTYDIPSTAPPVDPLTGKYKMIVTVRLHQNVLDFSSPDWSPQAIFRLTAQTSGALVGPVAGQDIGTRAWMNQGFRSHNLYFGSDCNIPSGGAWRTFTLTDPDNYYAPKMISGTQGNGGTAGGDPVYPGGLELIFYIEKKLIGSTGSYTRLLSTEYQTSTLEHVQPDDSAGFRRWIPTGVQDGGGKSPDSKVNIRMQPNMAYRAVIENVNWANVLQINLPTDSIYHDVACPADDTEIVPSATIAPTPYVMVGQPVNATFGLQNNGSYYDATVSYETRVFVDNDNSGTYNTGDVSKHNQTQTVTMAPGSSVTPDPWSDTAAFAEFAPSGKICAYIRVTSTSQGTANPESVTVCTHIGKVPKLHVSGGDLTIGGGTLSNGCQVDNAIVRLQGIDDGSFGASRAQYGVLGLGEIYEFGSNNARPGFPAGRILTFANTPSMGSFKGTTSPIQHCLHNPFDIDYFKDKVNLDDLRASGSLPSMVTWNSSSSVYNISGFTLNPGDYYVFHSPNYSVNINGNITYANTNYSSIDQVPRFAILAGGALYIRPSVTNLYGVYATNSRFMSCFADGPRRVGLNDCNLRLNVNGPVYTGPGAGVNAWRTYGAADGASANHPAEQFNLHPATIMSEYEAPGRQLETVIQEELPPRF